MAWVQHPIKFAAVFFRIHPGGSVYYQAVHDSVQLLLLQVLSGPSEHVQVSLLQTTSSNEYLVRI
jgi:hypothetical protein